MCGSVSRPGLFFAFVLCSLTLRAVPASDRVVFAGSIKEVPTASAAVSARPAPAISRTVLSDSEHAAGMSFEVALRMRAFDELQARIARGELVSPAEMSAKYYPLQADHDRVVGWLRDQGFAITRTDANRLAIFARGPVDTVAQAFQVTFARVTGSDGRDYTSAVTAPSLPADLATPVLGIHGLQPHIRRHALSTPRAPRPGAQTNIGSGYLPAQIASAYNANGLTLTGSGQTIAVYALAYPLDSDLTAFWATAGVTDTTTNVQTIDVAGGPGSSPGSSELDEAALDVEWATSLAPGAAVRVYGANANDPGENDEILQQVAADIPSNPGMHILCICIGGNELEIERDYLIIEAQYMATLASAGMTVLSASGDDGSNPDGVLQVTYPTSDPDVTGVGGTTLSFDVNGNVAAETGWNESGGGVSAVFGRPSWQVGAGVPAGTMRCVPDVAAAGDPNLGAQVVVSGKTVIVGGTSWSTPIWCAFCALINQQRATAAQAPLGLLNPKIYPLIGTSSFRDIQEGNNGSYSAGPGYDLVTGIGVPDMANLAAAPLNAAWAVNVPSQLGDRVVTLGQPATFFAVGEGAAPLSYQWQRLPNGGSSWAGLSDNGTYGGSATSLLVVSGTTYAMSGDQFRCVVSNPTGNATSVPASLTVNATGVTTLAGWPGSPEVVNATGWAARFDEPGGVRADSSANLYVSDSYSNTIRKVTPAGLVTTVAGLAGQSGSTNGPISVATFNGPGGVAIDSAGNLFVADDGNYVIREVSAGVVSTFAGTVGTRGDTGSLFYDPQNLCVDGADNIYVADGMGNVIRKVTPSGTVSTLAGSGTAGALDATGTSAEFKDPTGIAVDAAGNVYVADYGNNTVRKITPAGVVTTIAGIAGAAGSADGTLGAGLLNGPAGVGVDSVGNVYVADALNDTIRMVTPAGYLSTIGGAPGDAENVDGLAAAARFDSPGDVTVDSTGIVYVADTLNDTIRRIVPAAVSGPAITSQPASLGVNLGSNATFTVGVLGTPPFSYQWSFNNAAIAGATAASYTVDDAQESQAGSYTVSVSNSGGSVMSAPAVLTVSLPAGYPDITSQPQSTTVAFDGTAVLTVAVAGSGPFTYQWFVEGTAISGATSSSYTATMPGSYTVAVTNAVASTTSSPAIVSPVSRLINISSRTLVQTGGQIAIAGFVVEGPSGSTKELLIRGIGPALSQFGVSGVLAQPSISLYDSSQQVVAANTGWGNNSDPGEIATISAQVGAFSLATGSADSAMLTTVAPGDYSVELTGAGATSGVGLIEVYETDTSEPATLANISTRAQVGTSGNILIAGFVVQGTQPATVLIRAVGPTLSEFGVTGFLAQPVLTVYDSNNNVIGTNSGWTTGTSANTAALVSVAQQVGAFALTANSADCAMILTLQPGSYSAQVAGGSSTTGIALVEVYQAPPVVQAP
jgi:kumamolisin